MTVPISSSAYDHGALRLLNRVLTLYYVEGLNQAEIGTQFGLSTAKVNRLLKQAREQGMVEIKIHTPMQYLFELEQRLQTTFGVPEAIVVPQVSEDPEITLQSVGRAAAEYLLQRLRDGDTICISGGKALSAIVNAVEARRKYDVVVVPATGGAQGRHNIDANYLAGELAARLGGEALQLHAPVLVDTVADRQTLMGLRQVASVLDKARQAQIALVGIGSVVPGTSTYFELPSLSQGDRSTIMECGGTGEILAYIVDQAGQLCAQQYNDRVVGISLADLRTIPLTIGVAATATKAAPIRSVLAGQRLKTIITDEVAARNVLEA